MARRSGIGGFSHRRREPNRTRTYETSAAPLPASSRTPVGVVNDPNARNLIINPVRGGSPPALSRATAKGVVF